MAYITGGPYSDSGTLWRHQEEAVRIFMAEGNGVLEMATGTGKTRTAIRIIRELYEKKCIERVILIMFGTDLLEQWYKELLLAFEEAGIYRWYGKYNEFTRFQMCGDSQRMLLLSRDGERVGTVLEKMERQYEGSGFREKTLLLFDEVHGIGSEGFRERTAGLLRQYRYRLGLSATPIREFDEKGTAFIRDEIGPVIYTFGIKEAIEQGILCDFEYETIDYKLTDEERNRKKKIIAAYEMKRKLGQAFHEEELYRELARVNKLAVNKLSLFGAFLSRRPSILERCIIFVETKEYGLELQKILLPYIYNFHTYYGEDDYKNLLRFAQGKIQCLITCKKISEGIDIQTVKNVVLFSSDRGRLVTTQRIGRSLRRDPRDEEKRACIVDFICDCSGRSAEDTTADREREKWLRALSEVRRD